MYGKKLSHKMIGSFLTCHWKQGLLVVFVCLLLFFSLLKKGHLNQSFNKVVMTFDLLYCLISYKSLCILAFKAWEKQMPLLVQRIGDI